MLSRKVRIIQATLSHGIRIQIMWDEFKNIDCMMIYNNNVMKHNPPPLFLFFIYGQSIINVDKLHERGFIVYLIRKSLNLWIKGMPLWHGRGMDGVGCVVGIIILCIRYMHHLSHSV